MPLGDVTYQDAALDAVVASWPSSGATYRLFASDPTLATTPADVELTATGGYAPVAFSPSGWAAASGGSKTVTTPVSFGTSTGAYSDTAPYWGIVDGSGLLVYSDDLPNDQLVSVGGTGTAVTIAPAIYFQAAD